MNTGTQEKRQVLHLGTELEKLGKMVSEVRGALMLPDQQEAKALAGPYGPGLGGTLERHIARVTGFQDGMAQVISEVAALHTSLA